MQMAYEMAPWTTLLFRQSKHAKLNHDLCDEMFELKVVKISEVANTTASFYQNVIFLKIALNVTKHLGLLFV